MANGRHDHSKHDPDLVLDLGAGSGTAWTGKKPCHALLAEEILLGLLDPLPWARSCDDGQQASASDLLAAPAVAAAAAAAAAAVVVVVVENGRISSRAAHLSYRLSGPVASNHDGEEI
jgi:hypothetical protein